MPFSIGASGSYKSAQAVHIGAGGVWKPVLGMWIGAGGAWKLWHASGLVATVDLELYSSPYFAGLVAGYWNSGAKGSISPGRQLSDGRGLARIESRTNGAGAMLQIDGPGASSLTQAYLNYVTLNGVTKTGSEAIFTPGSAIWEWTTGFGISSSGPRDLVIVINPV